jgi:hypothetical protein
LASFLLETCQQEKTTFLAPQHWPIQMGARKGAKLKKEQIVTALFMFMIFMLGTTSVTAPAV